MLSLWDMLVASRYPSDPAYLTVGIVVFALSFLSSAVILPLVLHSIWIIMKPVGKTRAVFGNKEHDYQHYRITLCIFLSVTLLQVVSVVTCFHGIFLLSNIAVYREYIVSITEQTQDFSGYAIPSDHHVLYVLEAVLAGARENLLLWGFLFLVNYICKLVMKTFHFKTFTLLLFTRVSFVTVCSLRFPELIANTVGGETFRNIVLACSPFQTIAKSLRTVEVAFNFVLCVLFVVFLWRTIAEKLSMIERRPDGQPASPFDSRISTLCDAREMRRIKKYSILYLSLLGTELVLSLIQCQLPNFFVRFLDATQVQDVVLLQVISAAVTDVLSFTLPFLTILFIVILINSMGEYRTSQDNPRNYGSVGQSDDVTQDRTPNAVRARSSLKFLSINGGAVLAIALVVTAFTSYIWCVSGNRAHLILKPGDYVRLDDEGSGLHNFMDTCDTVMAEWNVNKQYTLFDMKNFDEEDSFTPKLCPYKDSVMFYEKANKRNRTKTNVDYQNVSEDLFYWFPSGTHFDNITVAPIRFCWFPSRQPCYRRQDDVTGFMVTCENDTESEFRCENGQQNCSVEESGMFSITFESAMSSFSLRRPVYQPGPGRGVSFNGTGIRVNEYEVIQFEGGVENEERFCHVYLVCYNAGWKAGLYTVSTFVVVVLYLCLMLACLTLCKFRRLKC